MNCFQSLDKYENIHFLIDLGKYDNMKVTVLIQKWGLGKMITSKL